jgi:hypothetical protein
MEITKEKLAEIVKGYPQKVEVYPRTNFEEQLRTYLAKCFGINLEEKKQ